MIYESWSILNANSIESVVELVNGGSIFEGVEGREFTGNDLAGCYIYGAAAESGYDIDDDHLAAQCECLADAGADFSHSAAMDYAKQLRDAK